MTTGEADRQTGRRLQSVSGGLAPTADLLSGLECIGQFTCVDLSGVTAAVPTFILWAGVRSRDDL